MHPNIAMIERVAQRLGMLLEECVFVGGATVPLFLTDPLAPPPRSTRDVDIIVEITTRHAYYHFSEKLKSQGFQEDLDSPVLCRWKIDDLIVDVMPIEPTVLGFSNRWYPEAIQTAQPYGLPGGQEIRVATPPHFLGTKIEAFNGRGEGDFLASNDLEDIVTLLDGRSEIIGEVAEAPPALRVHIAAQFREWLGNEDFLDALSGHLLPDAASQARLNLLLKRIGQIAAL